MDPKIAEELKQFEEHLDDITCLECGYEGTVGIISEEPTFHFWKYFLSTASFVFAIFVIGLFVDNESMILYPLLSINLFGVALFIYLQNIIPIPYMCGRNFEVHCPNCKKDIELTYKYWN